MVKKELMKTRKIIMNKRHQFPKSLSSKIYFTPGPGGAFWVTSFIVNSGHHGQSIRTGAPFLLLILYRLIYTAETATKGEFFNLSFLGTFAPGLRFFLTRGIFGLIYSFISQTLRGKKAGKARIPNNRRP